ncbi:hypothetical protein OROHE_027084 [Orobanche hederae]
MSVFLLPKGMINEIERAANSFWWGCTNRGGKGIRWKAWKYLCAPKDWGGMGFRNIRDFNIAMLAKQAWRIFQNPTSLMAKLYKARYFPDTSFLNATIGKNPSFIWSSILEAQHVIKRGTGWRVGDGNSIDIWKDAWLPDRSNPFVQTQAQPFLENATVSSLLNFQGTYWDEDVIKGVFNQRDARLILNIPLPKFPYPDKVIWSADEKG